MGNFFKNSPFLFSSRKVTAKMVGRFSTLTAKMADLEQILSNHHRWFHSRGNEGQKAELGDANLQKADFEGATLVEANLQGADLKQANLKQTDLRGANLQDANLTYAQLQNANLEETDLMWADLKGANIEGANLNGTYLRGADLSGTVGMTPSQLNQAVIDENTLLPSSVFERRN
jgi:uncharacterized protein YjbI with pentapeptide repeats